MYTIVAMAVAMEKVAYYCFNAGNRVRLFQDSILKCLKVTILLFKKKWLLPPNITFYELICLNSDKSNIHFFFPSTQRRSLFGNPFIHLLTALFTPQSLLVYFSSLQSRRAVRFRLASPLDYPERDCWQSKIQASTSTLTDATNRFLETNSL